MRNKSNDFKLTRIVRFSRGPLCSLNLIDSGKLENSIIRLLTVVNIWLKEIFISLRIIFYLCTLGSHYWYNRGDLVIGTFPGPCYRYILGLFKSTKKRPGPGPRYQCSVPITRYVRINFVAIVNQTRVSLIIIVLW